MWRRWAPRDDQAVRARFADCSCNELRERPTVPTNAEKAQTVAASRAVGDGTSQGQRALATPDFEPSKGP